MSRPEDAIVRAQSEKTAKARVKAQQKIAELQSLLLEHKQVARERQLAVRYHKVRLRWHSCGAAACICDSRQSGTRA